MSNVGGPLAVLGDLGGTNIRLRVVAADAVTHARRRASVHPYGARHV